MLAEGGEYCKKNCLRCYSSVYGFDLAWFSSLFSTASVSSVFMVLYTVDIKSFLLTVHLSLYLLVS